GVCAAARDVYGVARPPVRYEHGDKYYHENDGASSFARTIGGREVDRWSASADLPSAEPNGHTSTRRIVRGATLAPGDVVRIDARPDRGERAAVDYLEIVALNRP